MAQKVRIHLKETKDGWTYKYTHPGTQRDRSKSNFDSITAALDAVRADLAEDGDTKYSVFGVEDVNHDTLYARDPADTSVIEVVPNDEGTPKPSSGSGPATPSATAPGSVTSSTSTP